jgi:hypothetical protein
MNSWRAGPTNFASRTSSESSERPSARTRGAGCFEPRQRFEQVAASDPKFKKANGGNDGAQMLKFNEGKACDAIIRRLEQRENRVRTGLHSPEQEGHRFPVEIAVTLGNQLFALEHTGIEQLEAEVALFRDQARPEPEGWLQTIHSEIEQNLIAP